MIKETCLHVMNIFVFVFTRGKSCDKTQLTMVYYLGSFIYELSQNRSKSSKITQNSVKTCLIVFQLEGHYMVLIMKLNITLLVYLNPYISIIQYIFVK